MDYCEILVFSLNEKDYAVELEYVERIMGDVKIESIPESETFIEGVIDYEYGTLTILNLLDVFRSNYVLHSKDESRIIVLADGRNKLGVKVDAVCGVLQIKESEIEKLPKIISKNEESKVKGLIKSKGVIKVLLSAQKILDFQ